MKEVAAELQVSLTAVSYHKYLSTCRPYRRPETGHYLNFAQHLQIPYLQEAPSNVSLGLVLGAAFVREVPQAASPQSEVNGRKAGELAHCLAP